MWAHIAKEGQSCGDGGSLTTNAARNSAPLEPESKEYFTEATSERARANQTTASSSHKVAERETEARARGAQFAPAPPMKTQQVSGNIGESSKPANGRQQKQQRR